MAHAKCDRSRAKSNFARLDAKEMPELLRKIRSYGGTPYTRMAMELMALTFVRIGEAGSPLTGTSPLVVALPR
ncbi:MAG: intA3 [Variovorax sp.]|nr:intA3 [Variovorax sp.]